MNALTSLATNISPSPTPTTRGEFRRAATSTAGNVGMGSDQSERALEFPQTTAILAGKSPTVGPDSNALANRCATTSVSVSAGHLDSGGFQIGTQPREVFDDAVVHNGNLP